MLKKTIEEIPLCIDCKNCYSIKAKIDNNIEIKCNTYCKYFEKIVNINNYLHKCEGYENGKSKNNEQELSLDKYKEIYFNK